MTPTVNRGRSAPDPPAPAIAAASGTAPALWRDRGPPPGARSATSARRPRAPERRLGEPEPRIGGVERLGDRVERRDRRAPRLGVVRRRPPRASSAPAERDGPRPLAVVARAVRASRAARRGARRRRLEVGRRAARRASARPRRAPPSRAARGRRAASPTGCRRGPRAPRARLGLRERARGIAREQPRLRADRRDERGVVRVEGGQVELRPSSRGLRRRRPGSRRAARRRSRGRSSPAPGGIERQAVGHRLDPPRPAARAAPGRRRRAPRGPGRTAARRPASRATASPARACLDGLLEVVRGREVQRQVVVADDQHVDPVRRGRDPARLAQLLDPGVDLAERDEVRAEHVAGPALLDGGAGGDGARDGRLADRAAVGPAALAHERPAERRPGPSPAPGSAARPAPAPRPARGTRGPPRPRRGSTGGSRCAEWSTPAVTGSAPDRPARAPRASAPAPARTRRPGPRRRRRGVRSAIRPADVGGERTGASARGRAHARGGGRRRRRRGRPRPRRRPGSSARTPPRRGPPPRSGPRARRRRRRGSGRRDPGGPGGAARTARGAADACRGGARARRPRAAARGGTGSARAAASSTQHPAGDRRAQRLVDVRPRGSRGQRQQPLVDRAGPATAAASTTDARGRIELARRARGAPRRASAGRHVVAARTAYSSSTNSGLPSDRRATRSTTSAGTSSPAMSRSWRATAARIEAAGLDHDRRRRPLDSASQARIG